MFIPFFDEVLISIFLMSGHIKTQELGVVKTSQEAMFIPFFDEVLITQELGAPRIRWILQLYHISQHEVFLSKPTYENT
jgi:hypothetical protein